jgi:glycosyltransferase involved in cell wall biosynthesis
MQITLLIPMGIERPSGRRYFSLARELVQRGHRLRILALHPALETCQQRRFVCDGVEVWYVGQMHARKGGSGPAPTGSLALLRVVLASTLGMVWGVLCSPAEVYHLGKPQPINGAAALLAVVVVRGQRFYVDCDDDETTSNRCTAAWQRWVFAFWQWLLPALAAGVTVNTHFLAQRMQRRGIAPIAYVPNGVDSERFPLPPAATLAALRRALGLEGRRVIVYAGTLVLHNHPVDLLIDAFGQVLCQVPAAVLLLVGGGEDLHTLREMVWQRGLQHAVFFTGTVPHHSVPAYLALAAMSVDPVYDDAVARARSPLKLFESMALGTPVVTGAVGDRAELLDGGRAGVLVVPGDAAALAEGMLHLLHDDAQRQALAQAARQHVQRYTWRALAAAWEAVYDTHP